MSKGKDWTANEKSKWVTLGVSSHSEQEREEHDYYATDPTALLALLQSGYILPHKIWEPACGAGHLSHVMSMMGHEVVATDLIERGTGQGGVDFLACTTLPEGVEAIVTNPPYKYTTEFIEKSMQLLPDGGLCVMLLSINKLAGVGIWERLYQHGWLESVHVFRKRIRCAKNANFEDYTTHSAVNYAWFCFRKRTADVNCAPPAVYWL